jgi:hypothetical protein
MILAVLVVLGLLATATIGHAASLPVASRSNLTFNVQHPCPGTAATVPSGASGATFSSVTVTLPSGLCTGRTVLLTVLNGATVVAQGQAQVAGSTATVPTGTYTAGSSYTVRATVGGWDLPATWSYTPPTPHIWCTIVSGGSAGSSCTATVTIFTGLKGGGTTPATYYDVVVSTSSTSSARWEVGFDLSHAFYGGAPTRLGNSDLDTYNDGTRTWDGDTFVNDATRQSACTTLPTVLTVRGVNSGGNNNNFRDVRDDRQRRFSLVVNRTEAGYSDVVAPGC